jgi:hypothetical protein
VQILGRLVGNAEPAPDFRGLDARYLSRRAVKPTRHRAGRPDFTIFLLCRNISLGQSAPIQRIGRASDAGAHDWKNKR